MRDFKNEPGCVILFFAVAIMVATLCVIAAFGWLVIHPNWLNG